MPHIVINGELQVKEIFKEFKPLFIKKNSKIIKTAGLYLSRDNTSILIEALTIDMGKKIAFLPMISQRDDGVVIRIYPKLDVEKTNLVKKTLAEVAKVILNLFSGTTIGKTNLQDFLE